MDKGISHVLSMSILLYGLRRPIFNSQDKEPYSFVELKAQEKTGLLLMPTAKVTKNVSAAEGGGNVLCSILISIKTKAWLYSFRHPLLCFFRQWDGYSILGLDLDVVNVFCLAVSSLVDFTPVQGFHVAISQTSETGE